MHCCIYWVRWRRQWNTKCGAPGVWSEDWMGEKNRHKQVNEHININRKSFSGKSVRIVLSLRGFQTTPSAVVKKNCGYQISNIIFSSPFFCLALPPLFMPATEAYAYLIYVYILSCMTLIWMTWYERLGDAGMRFRHKIKNVTEILLFY